MYISSRDGGAMSATGMKGKKYQITLLTGEEEARLVHSAILLGDHETLSVLLATLGQVRRVRLLRHYRAIFGQKLGRILEQNLAGDYLYICQSIISEPGLLIVKEIHDLLLEFPTPHEELIIAMLCERSTEELLVIRDAYQKRFSKSLIAEMESTLQKDAVNWIKLLVTWKETGSCCNLLQATKDSQALLTLGLGAAYGGGGPVLASLMASRCAAHLRTVFGELRRQGHPPARLLEAAIPPARRKRILALIQAIDRPELFNARALWFTKSTPGRFWRTLLIMRLSRSKEFYKKVDLYFSETYNTRITDELKIDTGDDVSYLLKKLIKF